MVLSLRKWSQCTRIIQLGILKVQLFGVDGTNRGLVVCIYLKAMKTLLVALTFLFSLDLMAKTPPRSCRSLFVESEIEVGILSPSKNYEAFLGEDSHFLKIIHRKNKTEYTFDSNEILKGFFSLDSHAWIIPKYDEVQIWNFDRSEGNLIRVNLKHSVSFPETSMHKDPATGHTILKITYRREKINPETRRFDTITETILKDLETFEESRF